tara:strand:- start:5 stop:1063 length:1059 start_codon:yes stop_codon:yes gene_type:complete
MAERLGALGNLSRNEFDKLSLGVQGQNNATDIFGLYRATPSNVLTTAVGSASGLGIPMAFGTAVGNYQAEEAANKLLGNPTNFMNNIIQPSNPNSAVQTVRGMISDTNKDGVISNYEMNQFGQKVPGLDLAPMYTGGVPSVMVKGTSGNKTMPLGAKANPYSSRSFQNQMESIKGSALEGTVAQSVIDENMKSTDDYAKDAINQTNITNYDTTKGKYDPNFAKAVTRENQEASGTSGDGTYICTALYEMGEMKKYIYKYDQVYGKRVDPNVYRGYCLWGKYVATKLRYKGFTYKIVKPLALAWAKQMAFDLSKGRYGKNNKVVKVISKVGEGICYALGLVANIKIKKGVRYG